MKSGFSTDFSIVIGSKSITHAPEKGFENPDFIFCCSFQNLRFASKDLRLGAIKMVRWDGMS